MTFTQVTVCHMLAGKPSSAAKNASLVSDKAVALKATYSKPWTDLDGDDAAKSAFTKALQVRHSLVVAVHFVGFGELPPVHHLNVCRSESLAASTGTNIDSQL